METFDSALILLAAAIFFSLLIERLLQILKATYDFLDVNYGWERHWNARAEKISEQIHVAMQGKFLQKQIGKAIKNYLKDDYPGLEGIQAVSAGAVRALTIKAVSKFLAIILGIVIAWVMHIDMFQLIDTLNQVAAEDAKVTMVQKYFSTEYIHGGIRQIISGVAIGLGSSPVHKVIASLEKSRKERKDKN